jgi:lysyl-tRNA synthetase class 2
VEPFAINFDRTHTVAEATQLFADAEAAAGEGATVRTETVRAAGRVMRHRSQGKVAFADIVDATGKIQLYAHSGSLSEKDLELFNDFDLGDIVGVEGEVFRTRRGEVSIDVKKLSLLTKALRPLPDKWHGLKDPETRFRQRHVDFIVTPDSRRIIMLRSRIVSFIRRFLEERCFTEVETPQLHRIPGGAAARPFATHHNTLDLDLYLRIALELHLKRMIVGGFERVFEIGRAFRNEGIDSTHNPEFTLLELYQAFTDLEGMMELTEALIKELLQDVTGGSTVRHRDVSVDISGDWRRRDMLDLVREANPGLDVEDVAALRRRAQELGALRADSLDWGEALFELFERSVEDNLHEPTFVTGHPLSVSPLARRRADDPRLAERFELFIAGAELANAFAELTDPLDQRQRFEQQAAQRDAGAEESHPMDEDFIAALEQGMPPTGGLGIGIDRLVMLVAEAHHIREVLAFPLMRDAPEGEDA